MTPSRSDTPGFPREYATTANATWRVLAGQTYSWNSSATGPRASAVRFGPGGHFAVKGTLAATGMLFSADDATAGWRGIHVDAGMAVLDGARVEGVSFAGETFKRPPSAVTVTGGGSVTLRNGAAVVGTVDGQGIEAVGVNNATDTASSILLEGNLTEVSDNDLVGIAAHGSGVATIRDQASVQRNLGGGVLASGYDTNISFDLGRARLNQGPGVVSVGAGALVRTTSAGTQQGITQVNGNHGGLSALSGGSVQMGTCPAGGGACSNASHQIQSNSPSGIYFDAQSLGGSAVRAQGNDWGVQDVGCLDLAKDGSSTILVAPIVASGPLCNPIEETLTAGGGAARRVEAASLARGMSDAVLALVIDAEGTLADGDAAGAATMIRQALALATGDDDREGAFAGAARMLAQTALPSVVAALDSAAVTAARPFALSALAVAYASAGNASGADAAALAMVTEFAGTEYEAAGLGVRTRLAAEAGDVSALSLLDALFVVAPASYTFTTAAAIVAAAFPEADLPGARTAALPVGEEMTAGKDGDAQAATLEALTVSVWPNPSVGDARVRVAVPTVGGALDVAVFDALGRQVASLAEGTPDGAFEASVPALPAGVYLVRAAHLAGDGTTTVAISRLTVVR